MIRGVTANATVATGTLYGGTGRKSLVVNTIRNQDNTSELFPS